MSGPFICPQGHEHMNEETAKACDVVKTEPVFDRGGRKMGMRLLSQIPPAGKAYSSPRTPGELQAFIRAAQNDWPTDRAGWFRILDILHVGLEFPRMREAELKQKVEQLEEQLKIARAAMGPTGTPPPPQEPES